MRRGLAAALPVAAAEAARDVRRLQGISSTVMVFGTGRGGGGGGGGVGGGEMRGGGAGGGSGSGGGGGGGGGFGRGLGGGPRPISSLERARHTASNASQPTLEMRGLSCMYSFRRRGRTPAQRSASSRNLQESSPSSLLPRYNALI